MSDASKILADLVAIPSFVTDDTNEVPIMEWVENWAAANVPEMPCTRYTLADGRFNVYIGAPNPALLFVGHTDTVPVTDGWKTNPLKLSNKNGHLYGLGTADMKGSIAALLAAFLSVQPVERAGIGVLLYVDEEYRFAGMEDIVRKNPFKGNEPQLVISLDGNLEVLAGCRGLMKIDLVATGISGHAANSANGVNVITNLAASLNTLTDALDAYSSDALGGSTINVAYLQAGAVADTTAPKDLQRAGNVIPNYADCSIELRVANKKLTPARVRGILQDEFTKRRITLQSYDVRIDLGAWCQGRNARAEELIRECYDNAKVMMRFDDPRYRGYIDVQMLTDVMKSPIYVIGAGGGNRHGANEYTLLANLKAAQSIYQSLILRIKGKTL